MFKKLFFDKLFGVWKYRKINLYVVEDMVYYAKLVQLNLEKNGFEKIKLYHTGEDVITALKDETPDCIILDHKLSEKGLNGGDVLNYVIVNNLPTNVIILSGQIDVEVAAAMMKQGAYDYIIKNDMSLFNLKNTLTRLEDSINEKEKSKSRDKKIRILYFILLILLWIIALAFIF